MATQDIADCVAASQGLMDLQRCAAWVGKDGAAALPLQGLHHNICTLSLLPTEAVNPL